MAIDGKKVSEMGEVTFRGHERLHYDCLITSRQIGETVEVTVLRSAAAESGDGAATVTGMILKYLAIKAPTKPTPMKFKVKLAPTHTFMPRELGKDYIPQYAIIGGLVFVIAGVPFYLVTRELPFEERPFSLRVLHELLESRRLGEADEDKGVQAVVCSTCLAHDINEGFRMFVGSRLEKINGVMVRSTAHLVELTFHGEEESAIFPCEGLCDATEKIRTQYKINTWTSLSPSADKGVIVEQA